MYQKPKLLKKTTSTYELKAERPKFPTTNQIEALYFYRMTIILKLPPFTTSHTSGVIFLF